MALPSVMRSKKNHISKTITAVPPTTHRLCGRIVAPPIAIASSPENAGSEWNSLSMTICVAPRRKIEAPMVMMIRVTTEPSRAGSMASFSSSKPTNTVMATAQGIAKYNGRPASSRKTVDMPPSITNSPWAKLMTLLEL